MKEVNSSVHRLAAGFFFFILAGGAVTFFVTASITSDEKGAVLLGFSAARLAVLLVILLISLAALWTGMFAWIRPGGAAHVSIWFRTGKVRRVLFPASGVIFLVGWLALLLPSYWFGIYHAYFVRLQPLLVWVGVIGLQTSLAYLLPGIGGRARALVQQAHAQPHMFKAGGVTLAFFGFLWVVAAITRLGITPEPSYWHEGGAPVLGIQVLLALLFTMMVSRGVFNQDRENRNRWIDLAVMAGLWLFACLLWNQTPLTRSFFAPGPYLPNEQFYPSWDAAFYDISAQYVLLGEGLARGILMDKPLYAMFLALLHALEGQNYDRMMTLQVAAMAFMPVAVYGLGKQMIHRQAGLLAALLIVFQQRNAIASTPYIQISHSKLMLTEYPTALMLALFSLVVFSWLRDQQPRLHKAVLAGGILGLATLVRPNALTLMPVILLLVVVVYRRNLRPWIGGLVFFVLALGVAVTPWMMVIPDGHNEPYLIAKIRGIFETRIRPQSQDPNSSLPLESAQRLAGGWLKPALPQTLPDGVSQVVDEGSNGLFGYVPRHFVHNQIMAFVELPHTVRLENLKETLQAPYWKNVREWTGEIPFGSGILMAFNLMLVAFGVGLAWARWRTAGLIPLAMLLGYFFSNALARNSGARYLAPVDWILILYYALGVWQVMTLAGKLLGITRDPDVFPVRAEQGQASYSRPGYWHIPVLLAGFLAIGSILPLARELIPARYSPMGTIDILRLLRDRGLTDFSGEQVQRFMQSSNHTAIWGSGVYPRYYFAGQGEIIGVFGEPTLVVPLKPRDYHRFTLTVLAADTFSTVVLPLNAAMPSFPDGVEVAVIGCSDTVDPFIHAAAIFVLTDPPVVYWREPAAELVCPLPEP